MSKLRKNKSGFTLIELMIVVAILGILAALAVPAFILYVRRSKAGEASDNLNKLFVAASTYYAKEHVGQGHVAAQSFCTIASDSTGAPTEQKQTFASTNGHLEAMGFNISDMVYYQYGVTSVGVGCSNAVNTAIYTGYAHGDLDGDATQSTFELAISSDGENELYKSGHIYILNETE